jgi:hypothetical protein
LSSLGPGDTFLSDTPVLAAHNGTQPDLFLRWNRIPEGATAIDVVVFLHGFSPAGGSMPLAEKIPRSGLVLTGRPRPTLALVPRGNWIRHYYYDFPALLDGGIDRLLTYGGARLSEMYGAPLTRDRFTLAAHSGGGMPAVDVIAGAEAQPDELYIFDGLYGRDPMSDDPLRGLDAIDRWLGERFAAEPTRRGALRVAFIESQTGPFSRAVGELITARLKDVDPQLRPLLGRRYRVEAAGVQHSQVARVALQALLAKPESEIDWYAPPP